MNTVRIISGTTVDEYGNYVEIDLFQAYACPDKWIYIECDNVLASLSLMFKSMPQNARIYHNQVSKDRDVTPYDLYSIDRLRGLKGDFFVVLHPEDVTGGLIIAAIVIAVVAVAAVVLFTPVVPNVTSTSNRTLGSQNNELSERTNQARPLSRIPDIYGEATAIADLLCVPVTRFVDHQEVEDSVMVVGRGSYSIYKVRDGETNLYEIEGASLQVYAPGVDINFGEPYFRIGSRIPDNAMLSVRSNSVNGQELKPSNSQGFKGSNNIRFEIGGLIRSYGSFDIQEIFSAGQTILVQQAQEPDYEDEEGVTRPGLNFSGTYKILATGYQYLALEDASSANPAWDLLQDRDEQVSVYLSPLITTDGVNWIGPFVLESETRTHILVNLVASNGLYKDDGKRQKKVDVTCELEVTPVDEYNNPIGEAEVFTGTVLGSSSDKDLKALSIQEKTSFVGRCSVRMRRTTKTDTGFNGSVVDAVRWRDLFGLENLSEPANFGDVTTLRLRQWATTGALQLKERKLNMLVIREIPRREGSSGGQFSSGLYPSKQAADIICAISLDERIGNRNPSEIDFDNIYDTCEEIQNYFGTSAATEFSYTFDQMDITYEDTIGMIASSIFCTAYRRGSVLRLHFERKTDRSSMLFTHRNKLPGSATRTMLLGFENGYDGIEYEYTSPKDDARVSIYLPEDRSALNSKKYESKGVRTREQAWFHAYRLWNMLRYKCLTEEFDGTAEAYLLLIGERILLADTTVSNTRNGDVLEQNGLVLTLSQDPQLEAGKTYFCFLQLYDGTVESLRVVPGAYPTQVILSTAPRLSLVLEKDNFARTVYSIVEEEDIDADTFLVTGVDYKDSLTATVTCVNYDDRYYDNDRDYFTGMIKPEPERA